MNKQVVLNRFILSLLGHNSKKDHNYDKIHNIHNKIFNNNDISFFCNNGINTENMKHYLSVITRNLSPINKSFLALLCYVLEFDNIDPKEISIIDICTIIKLSIDQNVKDTISELKYSEIKIYLLNMFHQLKIKYSNYLIFKKLEDNDVIYFLFLDYYQNFNENNLKIKIKMSIMLPDKLFDFKSNHVLLKNNKWYFNMVYTLL